MRISLGGGGTDLPSYYRRFGGFCISAAIDRYVYITLHENFRPEIILKYSATEKVSDWDGIQNPIIKEALRFMGLESSHLEICSMADIPSGTGLGSSSAFTCALLKALHTYKNDFVSRKELARESCLVEKSNPGKGDQYASSYGGVRCFTFKEDGAFSFNEVEEISINVTPETLANLEDNLLLVFTGYTRDACEILSEQNAKTVEDDKETLSNLHQMKAIGLESKKSLESGCLESYAQLLNAHWKIKKQRSLLMTNPKIDQWYELGMANGALGGKLVGAGGGGFLLFYCHDKVKCRHAMIQAGLREVRFRFDFEGTKVLSL